MAAFAHNMQLAVELIYYEGQLLSHYSAAGNKHYLVAWADVVSDVHYWTAIEILVPELKRYMDNQISLLDVMRGSPAIYRCEGEFMDADGNATGALTAFDVFPSDLLPTEDSFLQ